MANENLKGLKVAILIEDGFEQVRLALPVVPHEHVEARVGLHQERRAALRVQIADPVGDERLDAH